MVVRKNGICHGSQNTVLFRCFSALYCVVMAVLLFFWVGIGFWLGNFMGNTGAFLLIAGIHLLLLVLFVMFRKTWIEKPLVGFLANLLMS